MFHQKTITKLSLPKLIIQNCLTITNICLHKQFTYAQVNFVLKNDLFAYFIIK